MLENKCDKFQASHLKCVEGTLSYNEVQKCCDWRLDPTLTSRNPMTGVQGAMGLRPGGWNKIFLASLSSLLSSLSLIVAAVVAPPAIVAAVVEWARSKQPIEKARCESKGRADHILTQRGLERVSE